jgi:hypothetical protein
MKNADLNLAPPSKQTGIASGARYLILVAVFFSSACASMPRQNETQQLIRIQNQTLSRIRVYVAFESSPEVRVLISTLEPNSTEYVPLPSVFRGNRELVVSCEKGRWDALGHAFESYHTSAVALRGSSTLLIRVREPIHYSDYTIYSEE